MTRSPVSGDEITTVDQPGLVILLGSGERTPSGRRIFDWLFRRLPPPVRLAILETPAGFEPSSRPQRDEQARQQAGGAPELWAPFVWVSVL